MLTLKDLKQLSCSSRFPDQGTPLIINDGLNLNLKEGSVVTFHGFNWFRSASGENKVSFDRGFGKVGGAQSWDDFTTRGRQWIEENYDPERCEILILHRRDRVDGIKTNKVSLQR